MKIFIKKMRLKINDKSSVKKPTVLEHSLIDKNSHILGAVPFQYQFYRGVGG